VAFLFFVTFGLQSDVDCMKQLLIFLLLVLSICSQAQTRYYLTCKVSPSEQIVFKKLQIQPKSIDSIQVGAEVKQLIEKIQQKGYLTARKDSLIFRKDTAKLYLSIGRLFQWKRLAAGNLPLSLQQRINFEEKDFLNKPFETKKTEIIKQNALRYAENNGYPFATIRLDSLSIDQGQVAAAWRYEPNKYMKFDTLLITGSINLKKSFLQRYLKIRQGQAFNQQKVETAEKLLRALPYLRVRQKPTVIFDSERAFVHLFLDKKRTNQIDGILGVLPNEARSNEVLITGEINLNLQNIFNGGQAFKTKWQRLQTTSQLLDMSLFLPSLFRSNWEVEGRFYLIKQDSSFVNNELQAILSYPTSNLGKWQFKINRRKSNLGDSEEFVSAATLPPFAEVNFTAYGVAYQWNNLDDIGYPHQGTYYKLSADFGTKKISKNVFFADSLYNDLKLNTSQTVLQGEFAQYFRLSRRQVLLTRVTAGAIWNPHLFLNDLFRVGGLNSLRGHNQNVFYASAYGIFTAEYRLFLEEQSYIFLFYDQAYLQRKVLQENTQDYPLGIGAGINLATQAGTFSLVYALGQAENDPIGFVRSKIHFGLVSRF
jgi:outer membrane protein assembly factor BamA